MELNDLKDLNSKLDFFCKNKVKVHIDLVDGIFLNGFIIKQTKKDIWIINEDKLGNIFLFTKTISKLQQHLRRDENDN
jgi:hypothetical protein